MWSLVSIDQLPNNPALFTTIKFSWHVAPIQTKNLYLVSDQLQNTCVLFLTLARDRVEWHWSADTLFWQVLIDHNLVVQYQRGTLQTEGTCLSQMVSWSMAAMLRHSFAVAMRTLQRTIQLATITPRKLIHAFLVHFCMSMGFVKYCR